MIDEDKAAEIAAAYTAAWNTGSPQAVAAFYAEDGAIVIISSIGGLKGSPVIGAYNISKAADFQLARNYAIELGPHNIRVNCVAPGLIKTDFARALWENPENAKRVEQGTPMRRIGDPVDIAGAAIFLASDAGKYMAGQMIVVDGGSVIV